MAPTKKPLTQRQWLNIMTIATAFMILLFVMVGRVLERKLEPAMAVERPFAQLDTLVIGNWRVSHSPEGWQQQPHWLDPEQLASMITAWQQFQPQAWSNQVDSPVVLQITTGHNHHNQHWQLLLGQSPMLKNPQQQQAILLTDQAFSRMFPAQLFNHWKIEQP